MLGSEQWPQRLDSELRRSRGAKAELRKTLAEAGQKTGFVRVLVDGRSAGAGDTPERGPQAAPREQGRTESSLRTGQD
jgi:hypothetical protein